MKNLAQTTHGTKVGTLNDWENEIDKSDLSSDAQLREAFHDKIRSAKIDDIAEIEVPKDMFRLFFPDGDNVSFENIRVFIEGTKEKTLNFEHASIEERNFGKK